MADQDADKKQAPPPPPPAVREAPSKIAKRNTDAIASKRFGFDPSRPLRYTGAFVWGTFTGTLDKMAEGARKGLAWGALTGVASYIGFYVVMGAFLSAWAIPALALGGVVGGAALGAFAGALTGGYRGVGRAYRREKYADDLAIKEQVQAQRRQAYTSYVDRYEEHKKSAAFNFDRLMQLEQHRGNSWADRVSSDDRGAGRGV